MHCSPSHERRCDSLHIPGEQHADAGQGLDAGRIVVEDDEGRVAPAHLIIVLSYRLGSGRGGSACDSRERHSRGGRAGELVVACNLGIGALDARTSIVQGTARTR